MKKRLSMILLVLSLYCVAMAQNGERPGWLSNKPKASNSTFVYVVERGTGATLNEATNNAILKVLRTTMMRIGSVVSWDEVNGAIQKGADWGTVAMRYNIPVNKVCEYVERKSDNGYAVAILCQVAKSGAVYPEFDDFTACNDSKTYSDGNAALKSALLPGLGQMGKNHKTEGIITMAAEGVFIGGAIGSYIIGRAYEEDLNWWGNQPGRVCRYLEGYNSMRSINIACISAAVALYVFNIVRAYTMDPVYKSDNIVWTPVLMPTDRSMAAGFGITFNF